MRALSFCLTCLCLIISGNISAQISVPVLPYSHTHTGIPELSLQSAELLSPVDVKSLMAEDAVTDQYKDIAWRFGALVDVNLGLHNAGQWDTLAGGDRLWRMKIISPQAVSLNFNFSRYQLPAGATLHLYDPARTQLLGAFTAANNRADSLFATFILKGDEAILEYYEPRQAEFPAVLQLSGVVHGYRPIDKQGFGFGDAGLCNVGINCPEGAAWQNEKRAVVMILSSANQRLCSGVLINNARQDGTPYVLTADHCPISSNNIFAFNYDSPTCIPPSNPSSGQTINGCTIKANYAVSDFLLLELSSKPPASYGVFYTGWSNLDQASESAACIHHPQGDVKKISLDWQAASSSGYYAVGNDHWRIADWDTGTTENASSGAPLFNEQHRVIGQLHGGDASCASDTMDYFGKFSHSWATESDSTRQLKHWLDPDNTGINILDGYDPNAVPTTLDAQLAGIGNLENVVCSDSVFPQLTFKNKGTSVLTSLLIYYTLDKVKDSLLWTGSLATGQLATVALPGIEIATGKHRLAARSAFPNNGPDQDISNDLLTYNFTSVASPVEVEVTLKTDDFGNELNWELRNAAGTLIQLGGGYPGLPGGATYTEQLCLYDGCYRFTIFDDIGDGFCCGSGQGYLVLENLNEADTILFNDTFSGVSLTKEFCVGDSCTILVEAGIQPVSQQSASDGSISLHMIAGNPPFTYSWDNGANSKDIDGLPAGTYTVTITDSLNCTGSFPFEVGISTGIAGASSLAGKALIYPNPSTGIVYLEFSGMEGKSINVSVHDVLGAEVKSTVLPSGIGLQSLDLSMLPKGIYLIRLSQRNQQLVRKVVLN